MASSQGALTMIAGHFGFAAGVKAAEQQTPLWALMLGTVWLDIVFVPLFLMGVETLDPVAGLTGGYGANIIHADATQAPRHIGLHHLCKLRSDRRQAALIELRGAYGQNGFHQIDIRQRKPRRFAEAQPGAVSAPKRTPDRRRVAGNSIRWF